LGIYSYQEFIRQRVARWEQVRGAAIERRKSQKSVEWSSKVMGQKPAQTQVYAQSFLKPLRLRHPELNGGALTHAASAAAGGAYRAVGIVSWHPSRPWP
jgi:hypothetical protein